MSTAENVFAVWQNVMRAPFGILLITGVDDSKIMYHYIIQNTHYTYTYKFNTHYRKIR